MQVTKQLMFESEGNHHSQTHKISIDALQVPTLEF